MKIDEKMLNKILANQIQQYIKNKRSNTMTKWDLFQECKVSFTAKINKCKYVTLLG